MLIFVLFHRQIYLRAIENKSTQADADLFNDEEEAEFAEEESDEDEDEDTQSDFF